MKSQQLGIQNPKAVTEYRGALIYRQEYGYKLITMFIDLHTSDEQTCVFTLFGDCDLAEEAERIAASIPLAAIDVYHFAATDGTAIELTIKSQGKECTARFIIDAHGIQKQPSFLRLDILEANSSQCIPSTPIVHE